jgi:MFS family permease
VYALLFTDHGMSSWQLSSLLVIWSATGILIEVPSGALADAYSRRLLLVIGPLLTAAGFALWVFTPSYLAYAAGFVLWGVKGSLASGALEALLYEELDRTGNTAAYPRLTGRAHTVGVIAVLLATAVATPVLAVGGYPAVGVASIVACLLTAAVAATFPEHRTAPDGDSDLGYLATLRAGIAEAHADRRVRRWLLLVPAITAIWGALEEYTPLLIRETGVEVARVPLWYMLIYAGVSLGGLVAAAGNRLSGRGLGLLLAGAAAAMAAGALSGRPAGILLVAAAFAAFQVATVVADTRLQDRITGSARATVTSVASLATDGLTIAVYGAYAVLAPAGHGVAFALLAVPYLVVAVFILQPRLMRYGTRSS